MENASSSTELNFGISCLVQLELDRLPVKLFAGQRRMKRDGRLGVERDIDLAQRLVTREVAD